MEGFFCHLSDLSHKLVYEDRFFLSFDLNAVEFAEYEMLPGFFHDTFSDADQGPVELVDPLEPGSGIDRVPEGGVFDLFPHTSYVPDNRHSFVDAHADAYLETVVFSEFHIEFLYLLLLRQG